jgi:dTDP-4-amino-4,6-dideoxygalactose transaminase
MLVPLVDLASQEASTAEAALLAIAGVAHESAFVLGARVEEFERWLAGACGAEHAVGVASGTDALELSLRALDIGAGDAVVTPAFSFIATAEAISATGARPVFCDVDPATLNASEETMRAALDRARGAGMRVRAILPVHLFGRCAPLGPLSVLAAREGLALIEDAAQALGARDEWGRWAGGTGDTGCFSFFPTKNLGAWGDGGAVVTSHADAAARLRRLRSHGAVARYVHAELGRNSRLDALQAAVLLAKTPELPGWQQARAQAASRYKAALDGLPLVLPSDPAPPAIHVWHAFVVRTRRRDELADWLKTHGIETRVYYPVPLHRQPCFAALAEPTLPVAEDACATALALPLSPSLRPDQQSYVIDRVRAFFSA